MKPRQPLQSEGLISLAPRIGEHDEGPAMVLLVVHQLGRFGEGHHCDGNAAPFELCTLLPHLTEMRLAGQSRQVAEKNQQEIFIELAGEIDRLTMEVE